MDLIEIILREEIEFPKIFASWVERDDCILFYNENEKESNDSNHAILYPEKVLDMDATIGEITNFYLDKGIAPMIYSPLIDGYMEKHRGLFESHGYTIEHYGNTCFMILMQDNIIRIDSRLDIVRLHEWDDRIGDQIFIPNGESREIAVMKNGLRHANFYLFAGYLNGVAVTTVYFHVSEYGCTRFDYIVTAKEYMQHGYAREILSFVVEYCRKNNLPNCYQWPAHATSERICYEAGFRALFHREAGCAVYNP